MKFKVGDFVIGNEKANNYSVTCKGFIGKIIEINVNGRAQQIRVELITESADRFTGEVFPAGYNFVVLDERFDLYNPSTSLTRLLKEK